jgi:hypothetical protein
MPGAPMSQAAPEAEARLAVRRRRVVQVYIGLSLALLVPGAVLKFGLLPDGLLQGGFGQALGTLRELLEDIRFGGGLRFWLGVSGASLMGLLLLYPLRKVLSKRRGLGSVSGWFQLHILMGLMAPVLILYHCNFGHGGLNANVALWSMLAVTFSGIVGYFVYARASRDFYATRQHARRYRDAILATLPESAAGGPSKQTFSEAFEAFEAGLLTPRQGLVSCLIARFRVEQMRRSFAHTIAACLEDGVHHQRIAHADLRPLSRAIGKDLRHYIGFARAASNQSLREQIWARWRLFHLPVFLLMIVAATLHVAAVWDMDAPAIPAQQIRAEAPTPVPPPAEVAKVASMTETRGDIESLIQKTAGTKEQTPVLLAEPQLVTQRPKPSTVVAVKKVPSISITQPTAQIVPPKPPQPSPLVQTVPIVTIPSAPPPVAVAAPAPKAAPEPVIETVYAELQRRTESQPMGLGGARSRTLADQIATLKSLRDKQQFSHSDLETGFTLTGKHTKVECASCHTAPLRETRQPDSRACVACHKRDDVHSGRRPNCAQCHTTNRWTQIVRRR